MVFQTNEKFRVSVFLIGRKYIYETIFFSNKRILKLCNIFKILFLEYTGKNNLQLNMGVHGKHLAQLLTLGQDSVN